MANSLRKWTALCKYLGHLFKRGTNKRVLAQAYAAHGIRRCPAIARPTKVRMLVYCGKYLRQSMRHHAARCDALETMKLRVEEELAKERKTKNKKELERQAKKLASMEAVLRSMHALTVLLVEEVLHMANGYIS